MIRKKLIITLAAIITTSTIMFGCGDANKKVEEIDKIEESSEEKGTESKEEEKVDLSKFKLDKLSCNNIVASSTLKDNNNISYDPILVSDDDVLTSWVEGGEGNGVNQWIKLEFGEDKIVRTLKLINGYSKNSKIYYANNRVKKVKVEFEDGSSLIGDFKDGIISPQSIDIPKGIKTSYIKITILDVYAGDKYSDTAISEVISTGFSAIGGLNDSDIEKLKNKDVDMLIDAEQAVSRPQVEKGKEFTEADAEVVLKNYFKNKSYNPDELYFILEPSGAQAKAGFKVIARQVVEGYGMSIGHFLVLEDGTVEPM